jgi:hypothetical protein
MSIMDKGSNTTDKRNKQIRIQNSGPTELSIPNCIRIHHADH